MFEPDEDAAVGAADGQRRPRAASCPGPAWAATAGCTPSRRSARGRSPDPPARRAGPVDRDRHGRRPRAPTPVQVYVGLDNAPTARERVDLALAELERTGALDRSLLVLVSPTGTGYVNYVATAALQYLALGRRRHGDPAVLAPPVAAVARHGARRPRAEPAAVAADPPSASATAPAPARGWRCSARASARTPARTSSCTGGRSASTRWASTGRCGSGRRYGSGWMRQVTRGDRLDVDREAVAVVNDHAQLAALVAAARLARRASCC